MEHRATDEGLTATLRSATQAAHQALDQRAVLVDLARGTIETQRYLEVLCAFAPIWRGLETTAWGALERAVPALAVLDDRRAPLLDADIAALGGRPADAPATLPAVTTPAEAAGVLYVLEGARLGGALIAGSLSRSGRPMGEPGYRFFAPPPPGLGERWRRFRAIIDGQDWSQAARETAHAAAIATFAALGDALDARPAIG